MSEKANTPLRDLISALQRSLDEHGEPAAVAVRAIVPGDYDTRLWLKEHEYCVDCAVDLPILRGDDCGQCGNGNDVLYVIGQRTTGNHGKTQID